MKRESWAYRRWGPSKYTIGLPSPVVDVTPRNCPIYISHSVYTTRCKLNLHLEVYYVGKGSRCDHFIQYLKLLVGIGKRTSPNGGIFHARTEPDRSRRSQVNAMYKKRQHWHGHTQSYCRIPCCMPSTPSSLSRQIIAG